LILDASAVVALILGEPAAKDLLQKLEAAEDDELLIGAPTLVEAAVVLSHRLGPVASSLLERFLVELAVTVLPFDHHHWRLALDANRRFGKGRHPAALNFGDCLVYASARAAGRPLLATGEDFTLTDLPLA
jgi:ribonuclease VapC